MMVIDPEQVNSHYFFYITLQGLEMKRIFNGLGSIALLLTSALISLSSLANEDIVSKIEKFYVMTEYSGDVVLTTVNKGTICFGYWLRGDAPGFEQAYSALLSAYHANKAVELSVHFGQSEKWAGSTNHYCKILRVAYVGN